MLQNNLPQILMAHLGSRLHYAMPIALQRAGMLGSFFTDSYVGRGSSWHLPGKLASLIPESWRPNQLKRLLTHGDDNLPPQKIKAFNLFGLHYARTLRRCRDLAEIEMAWLDLGHQFCELIIKNFPKIKPDAVMAFGFPCWPLFQKAQEVGLKIIMEKGNSILFDRQIVFEEHQLWPEWELPSAEPHINQAIIQQERIEVQAADLIICPSKFGAHNLYSMGASPGKIIIVPFGLNVSSFECQRNHFVEKHSIKILYAGNVTIRKGVQYLFKALEEIDDPDIMTRIVGPISILAPYRQLMSKRIEFTGQLSVTELKRHYEWADVFIFPTICDSFGVVQIEAMAAGLPVITTPNAGSVVRDGVDGFIVPIRDATALAEKIDVLSRDPDLLAQMSRNARERAQEFSGDKFAEKLTSAIMTLFH